MSKVTPMMQQYLDIKKQYPDAFLFYRVGDFYELFFEDAVDAARRLELTLTSRNKNSEEPIPMCGVPYHAVNGYIDTLVSQGFKVAICDQVGDPKEAKGTMTREIVQVITPGTTHTDQKENNYLVCIVPSLHRYALSYCDLMTGELKVTQFDDIEAVFNECSQLQTKEIVYHDALPEALLQLIDNRLTVTLSYQEEENHEQETLMDAIDDDLERQSLRYLFGYIAKTQRQKLSHLKAAEAYQANHFLKMDYFSKYNLELTEAIRTRKRQGTLLWVLDRTKTAMGGRLLKQWLDRPLINEHHIRRRQQRVASLMKPEAYEVLLSVGDQLKQVYDLERLVGKVAMGSVNARELLQLKTSLMQLPAIMAYLNTVDAELWHPLTQHFEQLQHLVTMIEAAISDDTPVSLMEGGMIKQGYDAELDQYIETMTHGKQWLAQLEARERERTGIKTLRVKYNKVTGYFIEISKGAAQNLTDDRYERRQTLANSERFITSELKELETMILEAEEKRYSREYQLFNEVRETVKKETAVLQQMATSIAEVDVLQGFAILALEKNYVCPTFNHEHRLYIEDGRHPVVEEVLGRQEYVPNTITMDEQTTILLITGPNMSGKSTYMRQLALIIIMAQMGSFVPATVADLPIFTQVFTRIGASDDLVAGQSTFMVEMMEANQALRHADENSLILFDELGRGTATYDGMALAQAIIEYLHEHIHAKTLFSTHYHELTVLEESLSSLHNIHVGAEEDGDDLIFLHKMLDGPADQSYGIQVARKAHLPKVLLQRAQHILETLEGQSNDEMPSVIMPPPVEEKTEIPSIVSEEEQLSLFSEENTLEPIIDKLKQINIMNTTPLEALQLLSELQQAIHQP